MKKISTLIGIILLLFYSIGFNVLAKESDTSGTYEIEVEYLIYSILDLEKIGNDREWSLDKNYKLMVDIDLNDISSEGDNWVPIGTRKEPFTGRFDGNGYTLKNVRIIESELGIVGFFGWMSESSVIENVYLENVSIQLPNSECGSLVGVILGGTVRNCGSSGSVSGMSAGGLIGIGSGVVENCYSSTSVYSTSTYAGGLISQFGIFQEYKSVLKKCYSSGDVVGRMYVAGLVGNVYEADIEDCYSTSNVMSFDKTISIGGLVGSMFYGYLRNSYFAGELYSAGLKFGSGYQSVGGIVGDSMGTIENCIVLSSKIQVGFDIQSAVHIWRITAWAANLSNNYVVESLRIITERIISAITHSPSERHGGIKTIEEVMVQDTYEKLGWNFGPENPVWEFSGEYRLPKLVGVGGQENLVTPSHLL